MAAALQAACRGRGRSMWRTLLPAALLLLLASPWAIIRVVDAQTPADGTEQCTPQGGTYEIGSRLQADTNAQLAVCNIVKGNVDITCKRGCC